MKATHRDLNTYVLIPGSGYKLRSIDHIKENFEKAGDLVLGWTLEKPGNPSILQNQVLTLHHHIKHITDQIISQDLHNIVLCGQNYGGLVITGVGDQIPERINSLIYMDGYIPDNSDVTWKVITDITRRLFVANRYPASRLYTPILQSKKGRQERTDIYTQFQTVNIDLPSKWPMGALLDLDKNRKRTRFEVNKYQTDYRIQSFNGDYKDCRSSRDKLTAILINIAQIKIST